MLDFSVFVATGHHGRLYAVAPNMDARVERHTVDAQQQAEIFYSLPRALYSHYFRHLYVFHH